ncbi:MAG: dual specificity protein phosphatase family protein [Rhodospirillales bacterium]
MLKEDDLAAGPVKNKAEPGPAAIPAADDAWRWSLNWSEIRGDLLIGSCPMALDDVERIIGDTGATAILSLQSDACRGAFAIDYATHRAYGEAAGVAMMNAPMLDFDPPDQRRTLPTAVRALTSLLVAEKRVYVHCTAGINRSPLVVLGYLAFVETMEPGEALAFIREARPEAEPSWEAFTGARADLVEALRPFIHVRAYYLHEQHPERDPAKDWLAAETDVIHQAFVSPRSLPQIRLDPSRA